MRSMNKPPLKGIIVPLVTPLVEPDELDITGLYHLIDHVIKSQVHGIFILGTTGDGPMLCSDVRQQMIERTCSYANHRTMVLVGISRALPEALKTAQIAAVHDADNVVLSSPYFPITQDKLLDHASQFVQDCPLPVYLYNKPNPSKTVFSIETIKTLLSYDNISGIKDSSGDARYFKELLQLKKTRPDWSVLMGLEEFLAEALFEGADGGVTGGANLFPSLYVDLYHAVMQRQTAEIQKLQKKVEEIVEHIYQPDYLAGLKYALSCRQLYKETALGPHHTAGPAQKKRIEQFLKKMNLLDPI